MGTSRVPFFSSKSKLDREVCDLIKKKLFITLHYIGSVCCLKEGTGQPQCCHREGSLVSAI